MDKNQELVLVGKLGRTREVHGKLWITPLTDFPERFLELKEILVGSRDGFTSYEIEGSWLVGGRPLVKFVGINNREKAARLTNRELAVKREQLVELPEETYYIFDLIGCEVIDHDTDQSLGEVTDVCRYPANDVYVIKTPEGQEVLFPAVTDFVTGIDTVAKRITVRKAGLFDETGEKKE